MEGAGKRTSDSTSHNDPSWVAEVQRIAKLLGFDPYPVSVKRRRRVDGASKLVVDDGCLDFARFVAGFPHGARRHFTPGYYRDPDLSWMDDA